MKYLRYVLLFLLIPCFLHAYNKTESEALYESVKAKLKEANNYDNQANNLKFNQLSLRILLLNKRQLDFQLSANQ
ncbi:MAG: hypothetical protein P4L16_01655 [Chlamydiales bacterium]|nr:hypothetical protein [Chlamydiales bacterium]